MVELIASIALMYATLVVAALVVRRQQRLQKGEEV